jgi:hypothetical protein
MFILNENKERNIYLNEEDKCFNCQFNEVCPVTELVQQGAFELAEEEIIIERCYFYKKDEE